MPIIPVKPISQSDFNRGARPPRPLPAPGNRYDGRDFELGSALFAAKRQVTTITLGGSTATGDKTTLQIIPIRSQQGSAWAGNLGPVSVSFTTGDTETLAAVATGLSAAAAAAQTVGSLADLASFQRVADIVQVSNVAGVLTLTSAQTSGRFSYVLTSDGSVTETSVTVGAIDDRLSIGVVGFQDGADASSYPRIELPVSSSVAANILGVIMDGANAARSDAGDLFKHYARGTDAVFARHGSAVVYGEKACNAGNAVYVRVNASGDQFAGAVTDTAVHTAAVATVTPTVLNSTLYRAFVSVKDFWSGAIAAQGLIEFTSDGDATAAEIVTGLAASLAQNLGIADKLTATGTDTLILTADLGFTVEFESVGVGGLAPVYTGGDTDHVLWSAAKFIETTNQPGAQAINIAHG